MMPKTWREVEIEKAWHHGYLDGWNDVTRGKRDLLAQYQAEMTELSALRPCDACEGKGEAETWNGRKVPCARCHGTGIAKEG
jgi:hypothetical protein